MSIFKLKDVANHIYSYLPIISKETISLNKDVNEINSNLYYTLLNMYRIMYSYSDNASESNDWLINDIERWMNYDIATFGLKFSSRYIDILERIIDKNVNRVNQEIIEVDTRKINFYNINVNSLLDNENIFHTYEFILHNDCESLIYSIIDSLQIIECINLYKFICSINFSKRYML